MPQRFDVGCAVMWSGDDAYEYGVVLENNNGVMDIVPVRGNDEDTRCFDEGGSIYERDRDKVRLRHCPPPFSLLCGMSYADSCFAMAGTEDRFQLHESEADMYFMSVVDDGDLVKAPDLADIRDHPWRDEKEKFRKPPSEAGPVDFVAGAFQQATSAAKPKKLSPRERLAREMAASVSSPGGGKDDDYEFGG